jgi:hypothetical protein
MTGSTTMSSSSDRKTIAEEAYVFLLIRYPSAQSTGRSLPLTANSLQLRKR